MKVSIIVPSLNSVATLTRSLQSVWNQTYRDYELIVMDGGSRDQTRSFLERESSRISYWQSAKDKGTTDAINSGLKKATGDLVTILNADDMFHDAKVLERVVKHFSENPNSKVLLASIKVFDPDGLVKTYVSRSRPEMLHRRMSVHLPASFFRREIFQDRQFNDETDVANDYEWFAYLTQVKKVPLDVSDDIAVSFSLGGRTNHPDTDFWKARECFYVRRKYFGFWSAWPMYLWDLFVSTLRWLHIRPFTWGRRVRRWVIGPQPDSVSFT